MYGHTLVLTIIIRFYTHITKCPLLPVAIRRMLLQTLLLLLLSKKQHGVHVTLSIASSSSSSTMVVELQLGGRSAAANGIGAKS